MVRAESAALAELGDRQTSERTFQRKRTRRTFHDVAYGGLELGDVRRGRTEPHGHGRRAIHVLSALSEDQPEGGVRKHVLDRGLCAEDVRSRWFARRPV